MGPTWTKVGPRRDNACFHEQDGLRIVAEVRAHPFGAEHFLFAVFVAPDKTQRVLMLNRDTHRGAKPFSDARAIVWEKWNTEHAPHELEVLLEMQRKPFMTPTERAALELKAEAMRKLARERAGKLLFERQAKRGAVS